MEKRKVIVKLRHSKRRPEIVYASAYDATTDDLLVSSTLDYILKASKERNWIFVDDASNNLYLNNKSM